MIAATVQRLHYSRQECRAARFPRYRIVFLVRVLLGLGKSFSRRPALGDAAETVHDEQFLNQLNFSYLSSFISIDNGQDTVFLAPP
jgi:hypothetical protein